MQEEAGLQVPAAHLIQAGNGDLYGCKGRRLVELMPGRALGSVKMTGGCKCSPRSSGLAPVSNKGAGFYQGCY